MDLSHNPPVCNNCRNAGKPEITPEHPHKEGIGMFNWLLKSPDKLKTVIKAGLCVFFVAVLGLTILFQTKGISWLFEINYNFLRYIPVFVAFMALVGAFVFLSPKSKNGKMFGKTINHAQIEALLRADKKLTPSRLAKATNTSEECAKKILDEMVIDGKLEISATDSYELTYSKNLWP
jgi:hypothetical protein